MRSLAATLLLILSASATAFTPDLRDLDGLPLHVAPVAAVAKQIAATENLKGRGPAPFAVLVDLPVALDGGRWDTPTPGMQRWRARVYSAGARSLLMAFEQFELPAGATLRLYDVTGKTVHGPYTRADRTPEGGLWTPIVPGETAVIELQVAAGQRDQVRLRLASLGHAYKNVADLGSSGRCNIDTACSLGDDWRNEIRSVVKLQIPFGRAVGLCTGTLINNLRQDDTPYVLTADHCEIGSSGSPASGVVAYWNFQNSVCAGTDNADDIQAQTGTTLIADDRGTDFTLLRLNTPPSASFNVYFAGFDAGGTGGTGGVGIHHPQGDAKKISRYARALIRDSVQIEFSGPNIPAWQVPQWDEGTTEPGSSGSGLWNQSRRIVGTLSGGGAACVGSVDNNEPDFYARLDAQWTANAAADGQLKAWLDPDNTGATGVAGRNATTAVAPVLQNDARTVAENSAAISIDVLANDPAGLTLVSVGSPTQGGSASIVSNQVRYAPAAGFSGTETFSYTARSGGGPTGSATVTITVTPAGGTTGSTTGGTTGSTTGGATTGSGSGGGGGGMPASALLALGLMALWRRSLTTRRNG